MRAGASGVQGCGAGTHLVPLHVLRMAHSPQNQVENCKHFFVQCADSLTPDAWQDTQQATTSGCTFCFDFCAVLLGRAKWGGGGGKRLAKLGLGHVGWFEPLAVGRPLLAGMAREHAFPWKRAAGDVFRRCCTCFPAIERSPCLCWDGSAECAVNTLA